MQITAWNGIYNAGLTSWKSWGQSIDQPVHLQSENLSRISLIAFTQESLRKGNVIKSVQKYATKYSIQLATTRYLCELKELLQIFYCTDFMFMHLID